MRTPRAKYIRKNAQQQVELSMGLQITGKNIDIGEALRVHIEDRISAAMEKYFGHGYSGHVILEKEGSGFRSEINLHLDSGLDLQSNSSSTDAYAAFDQSADRMEKRLLRYKTRLKSHHGLKGEGISSYANYIIAQPADEDVEEQEAYNPVVIAETAVNVQSMPVSAAVMQLDLSGAPLLVFRHAGHGRINIVYRRPDGNIGWVDPQAAREAAE
jgi:ribosomal subunit interface protein